MLERITPVVLTWNEEANIGRTLAALQWARRIVVLDSGSTDGTAGIARSFSNVDFRQRAFDTHAAQWNHAVSATGVDSEWILALDADYLVTAPFVEELRQLTPEPEIDAFRASFRYCIDGKPLRASLYPPVAVLFRHGRGIYVQDGHTQRLTFEGRAGSLRNPLLHDDRKPLSRWLTQQDRYMTLEAAKLRATPWRQLPWTGRVRRIPLVAPPLVLVALLLGRGLLFDGPRGWRYALQRTIAEAILSLHVIGGAVRDG